MARLSAMRYDITEKKRLLHRVVMFVAFLGCEIVSGAALTCDACGQGILHEVQGRTCQHQLRVEQTRQLMGSERCCRAGPAAAIL